MPVLRCFNVKYSPNLGDGLLSECLETALIDCGASPASHSIDLAGRQEYGDGIVGRSAIMAALESLPSGLRQSAIRVLLAVYGRVKWRPHYAALLDGATGVVIGGGNLLSDLDLNFPTKLGLAVKEAASRNLPIAIYACGMSDNWSKAGLKIARASFADPHVRAVFVRDADSKRIWDELMEPYTGHVAQVVRDPGLLAAACYPMPAKVPSLRPVAGLNLISHIALRYHAENAPSLGRLGDWYVDVAKSLIAKGYQVRAFTNGSPEDRQYAATLRARLSALGTEEDIVFLTQSTPAELCRHIHEFDVLIAFRMHAIIAAYSLGIPSIALKWDRKLTSFMASVDQSDRVVDVVRASAHDCAELAVRAHHEGIPESKRNTVLAEAKADVARLYSVFASGGAA
jgi:Uncharacterized conserved protein